jgi:hypothetical protein
MKKLTYVMILLMGIVVSGCQTSYMTPKGERLLTNSILGCAVGEVFFDNCGAGAAVGAGATVIDDQTD